MKTWKTLLALIMTAALALGCAAVAESATATAPGLDETVTVTLTMEDGAITAVEAATDKADSTIGQAALDALPAAMLEKNSVNVDIVSGATVTSTAILGAAADAYLQLTGADVNLDAWAAANGYAKPGATGVDTVTSATESGVGGINFGDIDLSDDLKRALVLEYLKGADGNYREMYQVATSYNNVPTIGSVEYVLDPADMTLMGSSEANTAKLNNMLRNPSVDLYWTRQIRPGDVCSAEMPVTPTYFMSYGVQITGTFHNLDWMAMSADEVAVYLPKARNYFETLGAQYAAYTQMSDAEFLGFLTNSMGNYYIIEPTRIVVTSPWFLNVYDTGYARGFISQDIQDRLAAEVAEKYPDAAGLTVLDFQTMTATGLKTQQTLTFDR